MAQIIGGVINKYNQLFANEFITNLTAPDKIIRRIDASRLEIFNPANPVLTLRLRGSDRFVDIYNAQGLNTTSQFGITRDASATPFDYIFISNGPRTTFYWQLLISTSELIYKTAANVTTTLDCPQDLVLKSGTAILASIAGSHVFKITSQGISTQSVLEDITATPPAGTVLDPNKNVFLHGVVRLQTAAGAASCQVEISPDGITYYVVWRAAILAAIGDVDTGFNVYVPAGWYVNIARTNAIITGLYKIRL